MMVPDWVTQSISNSGWKFYDFSSVNESIEFSRQEDCADWTL